MLGRSPLPGTSDFIRSMATRLPNWPLCGRHSPRQEGSPSLGACCGNRSQKQGKLVLCTLCRDGCVSSRRAPEAGNPRQLKDERFKQKERTWLTLKSWEDSSDLPPEQQETALHCIACKKAPARSTSSKLKGWRQALLSAVRRLQRQCASKSCVEEAQT